MIDYKKYTGLILLFLLTSAVLFAQSEKPEDQVKSTLSEIFKLSKGNKYEKASGYFAYTGDDKDRYLTSTLNYGVREEKSIVRRNCKKIKAYLELSDSYEYGKFQTKNIDGVKHYILKVVFKSGSQNLNISFDFVKIGNKFVLASFG